jgi:3-phosphoshikimate 1-carboxyvinyltransferase
VVEIEQVAGLGWAAPRAQAPLSAVLHLPGSKSMTNRALVLAALGSEESRLRRPLQARDTALMRTALCRLGTEVTELPDGEWSVRPGLLAEAAAPASPTTELFEATPTTPNTLGRPSAALVVPRPVRVEVGMAGTLLRFLPPLAALQRRPVRFEGDSGAARRPVAPLLMALRGLGVALDGDALPFTVHGTGRLPGGVVTLDASSSSQFVSGLLLSGARHETALTVRHHGPALPSRPHVAMSVRMLRRAGVVVEQVEPEAWRVEPGPVRLGTVEIEPDLSTAAPFLAAPLIAGGSVTIRDWPRETDQPGWFLPEVLATMGARITLHEEGLTATAGDRLLGLDANLRDLGELAPVLTALCALAETPSRLRGLAHLRGHESDRLAALATTLTRLGADVTEVEDGLELRPRLLSSGLFTTYDDHRLAQAGAVLGLAVDGVRVENVATVAKTDPEFVNRWYEMLGDRPDQAHSP